MFLVFFKNLILISKLVSVGYAFNFSDSCFTLSNKSKIIGYGALSDNLFSLIYKTMTTILLCTFMEILVSNDVDEES